jgi:putative membrane protein
MASAIGFGVTPLLFLFTPLSIIVIGLAIHLLTFLIDRTGEKMIGIPSLSLFKAFVASWTGDLNAPLEKFFESLGDKRDVELSLLAFRGDKAMKAMIVIPAFHPGPFRNVGSSLFPSMVQEALEKKLWCAVSVPHGLFGHDLDLSSQAQSRKVIASVLDSVEFPSFETRATPFVRVERNKASASCQIFGDYAFVTLTLAPEMMEDLPEELNSAIVREAKKRGLSPAIIIDAHNSIDGQFNLEKAVDPLRMAAVASLEAALSCQRCLFLVGASRVIPEEYGVEEGMGPGGISVVVLEVDAQKTAYVTIDGNNMISGLREKILSTLRELGIDEGEILTTDTHAVNGVVLTPRGYHPIGEAMDQAKLIKYVTEAVTKALNSLEPAKVSWHTKTVPDIRVIGEKQIEALCALTEKAAEQAKRLALTLFPVTGILLTVLLAFV